MWSIQSFRFDSWKKLVVMIHQLFSQKSHFALPGYKPQNLTYIYLNHPFGWCGFSFSAHAPQLACPRFSRSGCAAVALGGYVYAVGGCGTSAPRAFRRGALSSAWTRAEESGVFQNRTVNSSQILQQPHHFASRNGI